MADTGSATEMRHLASSRGPARNSPNLSGGWVVMLLSGLIAAVLFLFATQQSSSKVAVLVLSKGVSSGQTVDASYFGRSEISTSDAQLNKLIKYEDRSKYNGWVAGGPLEGGDFVPKSILRTPAADNQKRSMSIPVDKTHAVNGALRAGDRVDVINSEAPVDEAYVAKGIEVLSVDSSGSGGLGAQSEFSVTVAVDEDQALKVSKAIRGGKFDLVRSSGAANTTTSSSSSTGSTSGTSSTTSTKSGSGGQ